jgi:UDP-N-acetylglucosamine 2-epimerase
MKIAVITGSRAEWGLLSSLVREISSRLTQGGHCDHELVLFVTGSHLAPEFGETWRQIDYPIAEKIECVLSSNTPAGVAASMGLAAIGFGAAFERHRPDLVVVLGDRYEIFAAVSAAYVARIPIAHIHGGEITEGSYDDGFRHSITKMSHLHFTAAEEYRQRVIQLGESPQTVFSVGALGCDGLKKRKYPRSRTNFFVVAQYGDRGELETIMESLHDNFISCQGSHDVGANGCGYSHPRENFLELLSRADAIIGNSSSAVIEAPALGVPSILVGDRQKGRLMATSIIHCEMPKDLPLALDNLYSDFFQGIMASDYYIPYRGENVAGKIADIILERVGKINVNKSFWEQ